MHALLLDAPNPEGWPYRLVVTREGRVWEPWKQGVVTHAISIMPSGHYHFKLRELGADRAQVWFPQQHQSMSAEVAQDELAYVEHFVDGLPADAGLVIFDKRWGAQALALTYGLLARQVGWERAESLLPPLPPISIEAPVDAFLLDAWRKRLAPTE